MHEIGVFDEAHSSWVGMDVVGIGNCELFDATEGWYTETARLKYRAAVTGKEAKSTIVTHGMIRVKKV